jgi:hypothetical protein
MKLEKNDKFEINKKEEWKKMKGETKRKKKELHCSYEQ